MANVAVILVVLLLGALVGYLLRRHAHGIIPQRGFGIRADLGVLADSPRVRVSSVTEVGPDRFALVLTPDQATPDDDPADLRLVVILDADESGFELLHDWKRSGAPIAMVTTPGSRIVRLRSVDDLQPLTLRRADVG